VLSPGKIWGFFGAAIIGYILAFCATVHNAMRQFLPLIILIVFSTLFQFFSCSSKTIHDNKSASNDTLDKQISQSIEGYKNRQIHKTLTEQIIDSTNDDGLLLVVFDNLSQKLVTDYNKEYGIVTSWNKARQAIYMIWLLESEVNNGGFNQFYANSSGQFYKLLPDALKLVGANKFADLVELANKTFERENDKITKHQDGTVEGFSKSYENNPLNKYDDAFYNLDNNGKLQNLQVDFIRKHKQEFVDEIN
jgi:hypothetical protein